MLKLKKNIPLIKQQGTKMQTQRFQLFRLINMIPILDLNLISTITTFFYSLRERIPIEVNLISDPQKLIETNICKCDLACVRLAASLTILWIQLLLSVRTFAGILMAERRPHSGFKWPKHTENKFTWCDYTNFSKQFSANSLNFRFRWFDCTSHSKFVKLFGQFHESLNLIFGGFLPFGPTVGRPGRPQFPKQPNDP